MIKKENYQRRKFLYKAGYASLGLGALGLYACSGAKEGSSDQSETDSDVEPTVDAAMFFSVSLAEWSLHKALFANELANIDFPAYAREKFDIGAVEYVNAFFKDKAEDMDYLAQLKQRCIDNDVESVLIMCDGEGNLGDNDDRKRIEAVENHYKWVNAAKFLGCHSIRVNAAGEGTAEEVAAAAIDGLGRLTEYASAENINIIVENHGGYSSDGKWLSNVISSVGAPTCGTLPDFGNFCIVRGADGCKNEYDRYIGVEELMPFAKGVSAKSHDFDAEGNEIHTDYTRMLSIVKDAGYVGYIGIEYEGSELSEDEGISLTHELLIKVGSQM